MRKSPCRKTARATAHNPLSVAKSLKGTYTAPPSRPGPRIFFPRMNGAIPMKFPFFFTCCLLTKSYLKRNVFQKWPRSSWGKKNAPGPSTSNAAHSLSYTTIGNLPAGSNLTNAQAGRSCGGGGKPSARLL